VIWWLSPSPRDLLRHGWLRALHGTPLRPAQWVGRGEPVLRAGELRVHPLDFIADQHARDPHAQLGAIRTYFEDEIDERFERAIEALDESGDDDREVIGEQQRMSEWLTMLGALDWQQRLWARFAADRHAPGFRPLGEPWHHQYGTASDMGRPNPALRGFMPGLVIIDEADPILWDMWPDLAVDNASRPEDPTDDAGFEHRDRTDPDGPDPVRSDKES
jgi:hypothetical protein